MYYFLNLKKKDKTLLLTFNQMKTIHYIKNKQNRALIKHEKGKK